MKYKSKIDWWFHLVVIGMIVSMVWLCVYSVWERNLLMGIVAFAYVLVNALLVIPIWVNTRYELEKTSLNIKCGLGKFLTIPYQNIMEIKETRNPLASLALSMDRLEIRYKKSNGISSVVFISPKEKKDFITHLSQLKTTMKEEAL